MHRFLGRNSIDETLSNNCNFDINTGDNAENGERKRTPTSWKSDRIKYSEMDSRMVTSGANFYKQRGGGKLFETSTTETSQKVKETKKKKRLITTKKKNYQFRKGTRVKTKMIKRRRVSRTRTRSQEFRRCVRIR